MFGIKMPWTRRKERLAKELAVKLALEALEESCRQAQLQKRRDDAAIAKAIAALPRYTKLAPLAGVPEPRTTYMRYDERATVVNTDNHDLLVPMLITTAILNNMDNNVPAASSYCAPNSGASSYTPSYESSCSSSYDSGSSDSSSSSSSYD